MRYQKEETLILDEMEIDSENSELKGVFQLVNEFDSSDLIYVRIGQTQIGFVDRLTLVKFAEKIIELWKHVLGEASSQEGSVEAKKQ